jgi:spoIIIJ-associated protein
VAEEKETPAPPPEPVSESAALDAEVAELATDLLQGLLDGMSVRANVQARLGDDLAEEGEEPALILDVTGNDLGILIGRRGETLRALQYMTRLMLSRKLERWEPVIVDVESYRVRRRRSLRQLATRMADRVAFSRQRVVLEAMPANERRIIHIALRDHPQVTTKSIGEGERRKVTILPK